MYKKAIVATFCNHCVLLHSLRDGARPRSRRKCYILWSYKMYIEQISPFFDDFAFFNQLKEIEDVLIAASLFNFCQLTYFVPMLAPFQASQSWAKLGPVEGIYLRPSLDNLVRPSFPRFDFDVCLPGSVAWRS